MWVVISYAPSSYLARLQKNELLRVNCLLQTNIDPELKNIPLVLKGKT